MPCDCKSKKRCCCCLRGPQGEPGPQGEQGIAGEVITNFMQAYDFFLLTQYTAPSPIQLLLNSGDILQRGGFFITTTTVPNDTINFPEIGTYLVNATIVYTFIPDGTVVTGDVYGINMSANSVPTVLPLEEVIESRIMGIPTLGPTLLATTVKMNFMVSVTTLPFTMSFNINVFDFAIADNNTLNITIAVDIVQLGEESS